MTDAAAAFPPDYATARTRFRAAAARLGWAQEAHPIPGTGTLEISSLAGDQTAQKTSTGSTKVMLVGSTFTAAFSVQNPAKQPPPSSTPDSTLQYSGTGTFDTKNNKVRGV